MSEFDKKLFIEEVRKRINQDTSKYSSKDVARLNKEDWWIDAFLSTNNNDLDIATAVFMECLKWRANFGVEKIGMLELRSILERKVLYFHGADYNGATILWFNLVNHRATDKDAEKLLVYWLERHVTEAKNGPICLLIDMTNIGNQNMDFDFIKFLLRCFKYYYPNCITSLLFYETPSKFSAQMKVIRSYMDEIFLSKTENVTKDFIADLIPNEYLPPHMGGNDNFVFTMDELARCIPQRMTGSEIVLGRGNVNGIEYELPPKPLNDTPLAKRSVKFEEDEDVQRNGPLQFTKDGQSRSSSQTRKSGQIPENLRPVIEAKLNSDESNWFQGGFLSVCPKQDIYLNKVPGENDPVDIVILKNTSDSNILFKIKTTSPEKFRVRPSMGTVKPGGIEAIRLYLQNEYKSSSRMERFLLMALKTEGSDNSLHNTDEFARLWKNAPETDKFERKLNCRIGDEMTESTRRYSSRSPDVHHGFSSENEILLINQVRQLSQQQNVIIALLFFVLLVQFVTVLYIRNGLQPDSNETAHEDL